MGDVIAIVRGGKAATALAPIRARFTGTGRCSGVGAASGNCRRFVRGAFTRTYTDSHCFTHALISVER